MAGIGKLWAGRVYGTNTGNIFVKFTQTEPEIIGELKFMDELVGPATYELHGSFDDDLLLTGTWSSGADHAEHGELSIQGALTPEGTIRGTWESTIGTGGTFALHPHDYADSQGQDVTGAPEQLFSRNLEVGVVRLYSKDLVELIGFVSEDFDVARAVVTYRLRGSEVTRYADQFLANIDDDGMLDYVKITIQEPDAHGINRVVTVELSSDGPNMVRVQGVRESWVIGRAQALMELLKKFESPVVTNWKKYGLNFNSFIFIAMLIAIPEIETLGARALFVALVVVLLQGLFWLHRKFIPNASVILGKAEPSPLKRMAPTLISWVTAVSATLVGGLLLWWLTGSSG